MFIKIYREIKALIIDNKDDLCFYLKMWFTYLPLFALSMLTSFACYDVLLNMGGSDFNVIRVIGPLSMLLMVLLSSRITALDERHTFEKEKQSRQEII